MKRMESNKIPPQALTVKAAAVPTGDELTSNFKAPPKLDVNVHKYGIATTMNVEVVSPNHLRLLDDNDPPDPGSKDRELGTNSAQNSKVQSVMDMDDSENEGDEEVEMVSETLPAGM
ncbi:hypothetical protein SESBI_30737 [Sesbania bispinosa]|nr:hypothetical protein SESBI_30737 [Sesbania bispinosa]